MKALKWILFVLLGLILAFIIFSAVQDDKLIVETKIQINANAELIYKELTELNHWDQWTAFKEIDNNLKSNHSIEDGIINSFYEWNSEHPVVGKGKRTIITTAKNSYLQFQLDLEDWPYSSTDEFTITERAKHTVLSRKYQGKKTPFYLNFLNLFTEPIIKENLNKDLENFKSHIEKIEEETEIIEEEIVETPNPFNLEIISFSGLSYVSITDSCTREELSPTLSNLFTELTIYLEILDDVVEESEPIAIYHQKDLDSIIVEAAIPIIGDIPSNEQIKAGEILPSKVIRGTYTGSHENSTVVYDAIKAYAAEENIELYGKPWEKYTSSTSDNSESTKAYIYYPIKEEE